MIERYSRKEMAEIWTDENKYRTWLKVEVLVCEALAKLGKIPPNALKNIQKKAGFSLQRIEEMAGQS